MKILQKKMPKANSKHFRAMLCIARQKNNYLTIREIEERALLPSQEAEKIMECLSKKKLIQKEGCLFKKPREETIMQMI